MCYKTSPVFEEWWMQCLLGKDINSVAQYPWHWHHCKSPGCMQIYHPAKLRSFLGERCIQLFLKSCLNLLQHFNIKSINYNLACKIVLFDICTNLNSINVIVSNILSISNIKMIVSQIAALYAILGLIAYFLLSEM